MEVLQRTANRGSIATGGYDIDNSLKFEPDNSEILKRTYGSGGTVQKWTFSTWIKRTELVGCRLFGLKTNGNVFLQLSGDKLRWYVNGNDQYTEAVYRDTSAWYHIILQFDSAQATASNRTKIYVNGVQQTLTGSYVGQNTSAIINSAVIHGLGGREDNNTEIFAGYMAETYFIDNQALEPSDFGEYDSDSGIWKPKEYEGTYGTTGWYLDFEDNTSAGKDTSGNNNNFSDTNLNAADHATDTPTNNFCTLFPPPDAVTGTEPSIKEGGTTMFGGVSNTQNAFGTMGVRSGKWYFESTITNSGGVTTNNHNFGVIDPEQITYVMTSGRDIGASPAGWACASDSLPRNNNASASGANATGSLAENEIMGVAIDMDNGKIWWHRQGTWTSISSTVGNPANGTTPAFSNLLTATDNFVIPAGGLYHNNGNQARAMNFGGYAQAVFTAVGTYTDANGYGSFAYQPPSGYYALCTKNLAEYG